ncbi:MAG TPA: hypothetical protein VGR81_08755 [Candidatus Acidoferrales bacterium]|nr:hypothetical protein [Candidatus Acidoferrales bacterium]
MTLLDAANYKPPSKTPRYVFLGALAIFAIAFLIWRGVRYDSEEKAVETFLNAVVAGNLQQAYELWKPMPGYSFHDFQQDWGPGGFYGVTKSYRMDGAYGPKNSTSISVRILLSPVAPFPKDDSDAKFKTHEVEIWVNAQTHALSFPPPVM